VTIHVGIDASGPSRAALAWALARAKHSGEPVRLTHIVDETWGQYGSSEPDDGERILEDARELASDLAPGVAVSTHLLRGSTVWALTMSAAPEDLMVIGTHKTGYLRGRVMGTRSIAVASMCRCTVAVIPDVDLGGRRGVVVGVAPGPSWQAAVTLGALEAERLHQDLSLLHAAAGPPAAPESRALLASASELASTAATDLAVRSRISNRHTADALLDASRSASMLVLGASRTEYENGGFIGAVIHEVLLNINAPVIIARIPA
jgi:nucleotide-binding universal stress UspA family protein